MSDGGCPYGVLPGHAFWRKAVVEQAPGDIDPVIDTPFKISRADHIATAGSCFSQRLARRIQASRFTYYVTEPGYPSMGAALAAKYNYGTFSARYGNIYTVRQLRQVFARAYGEFVPSEPLWQDGAHWRDPFRPLIQPDGFETWQEAELDRAQHLRAVRQMMESLDVFIFTLGLTEAWVCKADGAVLPVCPGCGAGTFDPAKYEFRNFEVEEVIADLNAALEHLRRVNPRCRIILTVSPVPMVATYSGNHVLPASTYVKSVLRVAADRVVRSLENCTYFPGYEIVLSPSTRGAYFDANLRNITEVGIDHVMNTFFRHFASEPWDIADADIASARSALVGEVGRRAASALDVICDEYVSLNAANEKR